MSVKESKLSKNSGLPKRVENFAVVQPSPHHKAVIGSSFPGPDNCGNLLAKGIEGESYRIEYLYDTVMPYFYYSGIVSSIISTSDVKTVYELMSGTVTLRVVAVGCPAILPAESNIVAYGYIGQDSTKHMSILCEAISHIDANSADEFDMIPCFPGIVSEKKSSMRHYAVFAQRCAKNDAPSSPMSIPSTAAPTPSPSVVEQQTPQSDGFDAISQRAESWEFGVSHVEGLHIGEEVAAQSQYTESDILTTPSTTHVEEDPYTAGGSDCVVNSDDNRDDDDDDDDNDLNAAHDATEDMFDESHLSTEDKLSLLSKRFNALDTRVRAMRTVNLVYYRALAAKILKCLVSVDVSMGESFAFRHMDAPLRATIHSLFAPLGYTEYSRFSTLADGVTNLRNNNVHFNKNLEVSVREAEVNFPIIFKDVLNKAKYKVINDIFKLYDRLKLLFK